MKTHTLIATTVIAGLLSFSTISQAGPNCNHKGNYAKHGQMSENRMQKRLDRIATKLNLSDEQKTQFQALQQTARNEIKPLRNEKRAIRKEIRQLNPNASNYEIKLADAANRLAEITRQLTIAKGNKRQQMSAILSPEQLAMKKKMRLRHKKHHRS